MKNKIGISYITLLFYILITASCSLKGTWIKDNPDSDTPEARFSELLKLSWEKKFFDEGIENWTEKWFLDGDLAKVENTPEGIVFKAGPDPNESASHAVLWTHDSFAGNIKIEWDYTRLDTAKSFVNIIFIQATGKEEGPYLKDIASWSALRREPYMKYYFDNMNLFHISYAVNHAEDDYVRLRRYPTGPDRPFNQIDIPPDYFNTGIFLPNVTYHFTVVKAENEIFFEVKNKEVRKLFHWSTESVDPITEGRVGIRHMCTRVARYKNIMISTL